MVAERNLARTVRHLIAALLIVVGLAGFAISATPLQQERSGGHAALVEIDGPIEPVTARYVSRALSRAEADNAKIVVITIDTPGGLLDSTRDIVEEIFASEVPVVVYVAPSGAQAASAGTFITAAGHVAAMASATNIGAASPVGGGGEDLPDTLESKARQDAAAFLRSIAERTGRNPEALEATVLEARSYTASEALDEGIIDLLAENMNELLTGLDGRVVTVDGRESVLETANLDIREIGQTALEQFLDIISNPDIAFLLLSVGGLGIIIELYSPGLLGPGIVGLIALALAFVALGHLPVNWVGFGLIVVAMFLFYMEMQAPGISVFGIGGAVSFLLGGFLLFGSFEPPAIDAPSFRVSYWMLAVAGAAVFTGLALTFRALAQYRGVDYISPAKAPLGKPGRVVDRIDPQGTIRVDGEIWTAESATGEPIEERASIVVVDMDGLIVKVRRVE
ncbi:MAG: nodulation protein NfeD [Dehalococcoidia bacterium]|nr:nodulation protein NfeD [Dehalococcoidia bacterium]